MAAAAASDIHANLAVTLSLGSSALECFRNISTFCFIRFTWMAGSLEKKDWRKEMAIAPASSPLFMKTNFHLSATC